ncbi:MAG: MFS transporter, partial [Chloroflexota bacterium]|nr:MFS transporter [Chloroflexota bacterium]
MGYATAATTAGGLLALLPAGLLVDRTGARSAFLIGAAVTICGLTLSSVAAHPLLIYGVGVLIGAGTSVWRVAMAPLLMSLTGSQDRERAFSWNVALLVGSGALWTALAGRIPMWAGTTFGTQGADAYRIALLVGAIGTAASVAVFWGITLPARIAPATGSHSPPTPSPSPAAPSGAHGSGRRLWLQILVVALFMTGPALVIPFSNIFFQRQHGLAVDRIGLILALSQLVTAAAVFGSGELAARLGPLRTLAGWSLVFGPTLWALAYADAIRPAIGLFMLQGMVAPSTYPLVDQILLENAPVRRYGTISGWRNAATEASGMAGASVGGVLLKATSFPVLFMWAGTFGLVAAVALIVSLRKLPRS